VPIASEYMVKLDCDAHTLTFGANGVWWTVAYTNLPDQPLYPAFDVNVGQFTVTHIEPPKDEEGDFDILHPAHVYQRNIREWNIARTSVLNKVNIDKTNFLVLGDAGVGKSSFWNTVCSGLRGRMYLPVHANAQSEHVTRRLYRIPLLDPNDEEIRATGYDCWGWVPSYMSQIMHILAGKIKENDHWETVPNLNGPNMLFKDEIHCVMLMISYTQRGDVAHACEIINLCRSLEIPVKVILTRCDLADGMKSNLSNFFQNRRLREEQVKLAQQLRIDTIHVLPVTSMNRQNEAPLSDQIMSRSFSICMKAFLSCLYATSDFIEKVARINGIRYNFK
jgi:hypothetical protein